MPEQSAPIKIKAHGSRQFELFAQRYVRVPRGHGALKPLRIRPWQKELVGSVFDQTPQPRVGVWCLPRGNGKSTKCAALGLWDLYLGQEGASVVVVACDERQAGIIFGIAARMVELHPELSDRAQVFKDRIVIPARGASFQVLPAEARRLEGLDPSLALVDEIGRVDQETWEVICLASGKRERSVVVGIGTPGPDPDNVLAQLRAHADEDDPSFVWREFSAASFEDHPVDCEHCAQLANPALGDFLALDGLRAVLPPKTRELSYRRARLCQFVTGGAEQWITREVWDGCKEPARNIPNGAPVVLALDGSFSGDATAVIAVSVEIRPRVEVVGVWEPQSDPTARVDVLAVEESIRQAARRWRLQELCADPFLWTRTMAVLQDEGLPVVEHPQTAARMAPATQQLTEAIHNREISHPGDARLTAHVLNATIRDDARGHRLSKINRNSKRRIDAAVALVMAHSRAKWWASQRPPSRRVAAFR
jgi:phage terminase large subunit-like protein